ncbi:hypothetical protein Tco_0881421 [Tanacetum coccineum]
MVPTLWSPIKVAYDKHATLVTNVNVNEWYGYGHLEEIEVRRAYQKLYKFMEGDFPRLHLNEIEDMLLLVVSVTRSSQNRRDLPRDISLDRLEVLRYDTKGVKVRKGIMQTKTELTLKQTQQGVSDEVLVIPMVVAAASPRRVRFIATCSYPTDICKDIMKAQVHVSKDFRYSARLP